MNTYLVNLLLEFRLDFIEVTNFVLLFLKLILEFLANEVSTGIIVMAIANQHYVRGVI